MDAFPKIPMINFDIKESAYGFDGPIDMGEKLLPYIQIHYQEDPIGFRKEVDELLELRMSALSAARDFMGLVILKRYFRQLQFLANRFPMQSGQECEMEFTWDHLYSESEIIHTDIRFEQQAILYNIASMHSYLGCVDKRNTDDGIKISCTHFQYAAWAYQTLRDTYSKFGFTSDLDEDIMSFKMNMMLAQAQECVYEKSVIDNRKPSINAKIASQIIDYYRQAQINCDKGEFQSVVGSKQIKEFKQYCQFKMSYYAALTFYYSAISSYELKKFGEAVGYIQAAEAKVNECVKMKYLKEFADCLKFTSELIETKAKAIKKDNDFVYHEKIVSMENLPEVKGVSLVKPLPIELESDKDVAMPDIFARLVSMKAHELSSLYSEEKAKLLREMNGSVDEKNQQLEQFMSAMQVDKLSLETNVFENHLKMPKELLESCAGASIRANLTKVEIPSAMRRIVDTSVQTKSLLDDIEEMLEEEHREYKEYKKQQNGKYNGSNEPVSDSDLSSSSESESNDQHKRRVATSRRPNNPRKTKLKEILNKYDILSKSYKDSSESNKQLHEAFTQIIKNIEILSLPISELDSRLPKVDESKLNLTESQQTREKLLAMMDKVNEMKTQRDQLFIRFKLALQDDDVTRHIASRENDVQTNESAFFQEQLKKHEQLKQYLEQNLTAQDNILRALAESNAAYTLARRQLQEASTEREQFINSLTVSFKSVNELLDKAERGVEFFDKLNKQLSSLLDEVKDFCSKQKVEYDSKKRLMDRVNSMMNGNNGVHNNNPGPSMPSHFNPSLHARPSPGSIDQRFMPNAQMGPELTAAEISNILNSSDVSASGAGRPKLKDFLPMMKPQSFGGAGASAPQKPRLGPPIHDPSILQGGGMNNISLNNNNPTGGFSSPNAPSHPMSQPTFQQPFVNNQPPPINRNIPKPTLQPVSTNSFASHLPTSQIHPSQIPSSMSHMTQFSQPMHQNVPQQQSVSFATTPNVPMASYNQPAPIPQNFNQYQPNQNVVPNLQQQYQQALMDQEKQRQQKELEQKLLEQQIKEKDIELRKKQLEEQEKQLKLQQQQFDLQRQQQDFLLQQKLMAQQQQIIHSVHSPAQMTASSINPQPAQMMHLPTNLVNPTYQQQPATPILSPTGQGFMLNQQAPVKPSPASVSASLNNTESIKPDSVYKPGYYNQMQFPTPSNLPMTSQPSHVSNNIGSGVPIKSPSSQTIGNVIIPPSPSSSGTAITPQSTLQQPTQNLVPSKPAFQSPVVQQTKPIQPQPQTPKPTAIDDLLGLFDNTSLNSSSFLQPSKIETVKEPTSSTNTIVTESYVDITPKNGYSIEPVVSSKPIEKKEENKVKEPEYIVSNPTPPPPPVTVSIMDFSNLQSLKLFNFLKNNNSSRIDNFLNDYKKLEHYIDQLNQKSLSSNLTMLEKEWKELNDYQEKQLETTKYTISVARLYPAKNRYQDLLPFDQTRVRLNIAGDDYINATNFGQLVLSTSSKQTALLYPHFITAQLPTDFGEFWSMVLQEKCELVTCLCRENEFDVKNGSPSYYWPVDKQNPLSLSRGIKVSLQSVKETEYSVQRVLTISSSNTNTTRTIVLFQYLFSNKTSAPVVTGLGQNEMPESMSNFLRFVKDCERFYMSEQRNKSSPVLVHCVNGVSRSAMFLLVYSCIQTIDTFYDEEQSTNESASPLSLSVSDLVTKYIKLMRTKRKYMIHNISHLKYAYDCLAAYMRDILIKKNVIREDQTSQSHSRPEELKNGNGHVNKSGLGKPAVAAQVLNLADVCDPSKFCLDLASPTSEENSKRKGKFTKDDFLQHQQKNPLINDPFKLIDSIKK